MMPDSSFLRGLMVALIFGVPAGAIGALTIQRTLRGGFWAGLVTGLGSSTADTLYACIGAFGVTMISDVLLRYQTPFRVAGGLFIGALGIAIFRKPAAAQQGDEKALRLPACFASSLLIAVANPATILAFFTAFTALGITQAPTAQESLLLVLGIAVGTTLWWAALSGLAAVFRKRITPNVLAILNRLLGSLLVLFGLYALIQAAGIIS